MTATLKIKNDRYYAVINYKENGKYKQKWIALGMPVKNNKRKAEAKLIEIKQQFDEQYTQPLCGDNLPFILYIKQWLDEKKGLIELSTWEGYEIYALKHIIPFFEPLDLKITEVKPQHIREYYEYKYSNGRRDGKAGGLSIASIKKHSIVLKEVLSQAVMDGIIQRNPADGVRLPAKDISQRTRRFLTLDEANEMLKAFNGNRLQPLIYVTLYYGLRRSEVLGLRWSAIDFENNTLTINHTVVKNVTTVKKDKTKTQNSFHTYLLIDDVKTVLLEHKARQDANKKSFGANYVNNDYVFTWDNGDPFKPDYITRAFEKVVKKNGISTMRFHDLRHSTASILYDKGWDLKDIQLWLRHSSIDVTADIYTHITESRKAKMANELNSTLKIN